MSNYRYRVQNSRFGLFAGVTSQVVQPRTGPIEGNRISRRVWIDTAQVEDGFRGTALALSDQEVQSLSLGLGKVAHDIETADPSPCVIVAVRALEIVLVDYVEAALAPAIAGWAAQEFGFTGPRVTVHFDDATGQYVFGWSS